MAELVAELADAMQGPEGPGQQPEAEQLPRREVAGDQRPRR